LNLSLRCFLPCLAVLLLSPPSLTHARSGPVGGRRIINVPSATYPTIQSGVDAASLYNGDTVLVADGTYSGPGNRDIDFNGKNITVASQNGPTKTIIDCGGYKSADGSGDHRGFYIHSGEKTATISGFTVKNGFEAYGSAIDNSNGGGILILNSNAGTITLTNCNVSGNTAYGPGNVIYGIGSAGLGEGGGIYTENNSSGTIVLTNCTVSGNTALNSGGGISNYNIKNNSSENNSSGTIVLTNCTVSGNTAQNGGGVTNGNYNRSSNNTITLTNCIFREDVGGEIANDPYANTNVIATYSDIQGGYPGTGNIDKDPLFVNAAAGDLHLKPGSPCLGAGTPDGAPATDLDGNPRPNPPSMGAYEVGAVPATITGFTLSPNQIAAPGPKVAASVSVTGNFTKVTVSPAPGSLSTASPTFNLLTNSGGGWGGSFPTAFLKLAKTNPVTFIATGTRADGSTATMAATLQIGALPTLTLSLSPDKTAIHRNETFTLSGYVSDLATVPAPQTTVQITLPQGINYVSSNGFTYDSSARTLTLAAIPLSPNLGFYPISVMLQAAPDAPKQTPLVMPAVASCAGFQAATQNPTVSVEAGLIPLGVDVNATGGYGLLDGTAQVHEALGTPPLYATLSPVSSLNHIWLGVDYVIPANGATVAYSSELSVGSILGRLGLIAPDASPTYDATFPSIGSSVTMGVRLNDAAGVMNIANIFLQAASALAKYGPPPSSKDLLDVYDDIEHVKAFKEALHDLNPPPSGLGHRLVAVAAAVKALADMDETDTQRLSKIVLKLFGKDVKAKELRRFFKLLGRGETIFNLLQILADETTLVIQTGGDDMVVTFTGSPLHSSGSSASRAVPQEVAIKSKGAKL